MKNIFSNLLFKVFIAIVLGILFGQYLPESINRIFTTFNAFFGQFLSFSIPLIIMGLIMPAISDLGKGAGKLLLITTIIAYGSTLFSGFITYFTTSNIFPQLLESHVNNASQISDSGQDLIPYFSINIPPILDVMSALVFAFIIGLGLSFQEKSSLKLVVKDFQKIIMQLIENVIVPLLPLFILGIFVSMSFNGKVFSILSVFMSIIGVIFALHILLLLLQYTIAGVLIKQNPLKLLSKIMPAYFTALGTQSSAATIPVTLKQTIKNGVSDKIAGFVIPLCATIHLSGSIMKITACAMALMILQGMPFSFTLFAGFIFVLGIAMIAAPGVPGGAIMAAVGILQSMLGFNEEMVGLMIALYIAMDSFGTACNVSGDGAISIVVDKITKEKLVA
ncbi:dicarboxylate/amino acid:cation symporter [Oceanihabitans sediminis]|uniref:Dicarboxylate/amino acid:cation symporter n=2 Tax=Pseudomonadati TaxID=3379134 RepID=A0A368P577_9FLAO|nr:dicarboxylate/amino acid:cation symporter [Oceanihabitans sediminis]MDX1277525.1 dicarboxylate/amino acid:cation symporter [Oceanihabitans sediminis]MDX1773422.1 dicarboxylate/amino acid:cation symporter [Oceanihabitans sediminis]RBP32877.1 Na+/H+-dicarboxylate symporter [Oceanihabitans sediminis]RCU57596.1 dicarboxylate/amino acid:cation symporter [Oceanihabitans sediminis]